MKRAVFILCIMAALLMASTAWANVPVKVPDLGIQAEGEDAIAVVTYERDAAFLTNIHLQASDKCKAGTMSRKSCAKINDLYQKTRDLFIWQGDKMEIYILRRTKRTGEAYMEIKKRYEEARSELFDFARRRDIRWEVSR